MHIIIHTNYRLHSWYTLPVQRILCLLRSQFHNDPSTSPHFLQYSHSCHHHSHRCKLFAPFCDWNHLLGPADAAVFFLHSKPKHEKYIAYSVTFENTELYQANSISKMLVICIVDPSNKQLQKWYYSRCRGEQQGSGGNRLDSLSPLLSYM